MRFNEHDFDELVVEDVRRPFLAPSDFVSMETVNGRSRFYRRNLTSYSIEVDVRIILDSEEDVRQVKDKLKKKLFTFEPAQLELPDEPDKINIAICHSEELEVNRHTGFATLTFTCFDPHLYSKRTKQAEIYNGVAYIDNEGALPTYAAFYLKPHINVVEIVPEQSGNFLQVTGRLTGARSLYINCEDEYVSLDGNNAMQLLSFHSDFFRLEPGENYVSVSGADGIVSWTERW